jgi:hypothetical protein
LNSIFKTALTKSLQQAFNCLEDEHKRLLVSRLDTKRKGFFQNEEDFKTSFERHRPKGSKKTYEKIEEDLSASFIKKTGFGERWIHPSIRDLVIEFLISMKQERYNFLSVCQLSGTSLALSIGGGSEGRRNFPLIVDSQDMVIVESRILELIKELPIKQITNLMTIITEIKLKTPELADTTFIIFIDKLFENALSQIINRLTDKQEPLDNDFLKQYFHMAKISKSYRTAPTLVSSWNERLKKLEQALEEVDAQNYLDELPALNELFEFVDLLKANDPRFLEYIDYPKCITKHASRIIKHCIDETEKDYLIEGDEEDLCELYMNESDRYNSLCHIAERLFNLNIELEIEKTPNKVLALLEGEKNYWSEQADEYYHPEPDYDDHYYSPSEVSIDSIFRDL